MVCVDEKTGIQANEHKYPLKSAQPGRPARKDYEYIRHGTQSLIAGFSITERQVMAQCRRTRTAADLLAFMKHLADRYASAKQIIVVWDNLNIHHDEPSGRWQVFNRAHGNRFVFHYTPIHASWVNQIEAFSPFCIKAVSKTPAFSRRKNSGGVCWRLSDVGTSRKGILFHWAFHGYPLQNKEAS